MAPYRDTAGVGVRHQEGVLADGLLRNGVDGLAARRAHLRAMTMARQAAEQRHMHPAGPAQCVSTREHAVALRAELARIDAEHRQWLHDQGEAYTARGASAFSHDAAAPQGRSKSRRLERCGSSSPPTGRHGLSQQAFGSDADGPGPPLCMA